MTSQSPAIPRYALLGEDPTGDNEELVHCETIAARSTRYEWEIPAHRHPALCQFLLVFEGQADIRLGNYHEGIEGPFVLVAPSGAVHAFRFSPQIDGLVVTLSNRLVQALGEDALMRRLMEEPRIFAIRPSTASRLRIIGAQVLLATGHDIAREMLRRALAEAMLRVMAEDLGEALPRHRDRLVGRFQALVESHCRTQRRLSFYASELGCTERTLTRHVREALDVGAIEYVNQRLAVEATRILRFTNANCADVANELGFDDPSYFSRFFRRMTGQRPSEISGKEMG